MPRLDIEEFERACFELFEDDVDTLERYDRWDGFEEERGRELGYGEEE